jgi:glucan phosphoethanolaminetransferase (alkaline phosphatase superfamily)
MPVKKIAATFTISMIFTLFVIGFEYLITGRLDWIAAALFMVFIYLSTLFLRSYIIIYTIIIVLTFIQALFWQYFHREALPADIRLFWAHMEESIESLIALPSLFVLPFLFLMLGMVLIWVLKYFSYQPIRYRNKGIYAVLFLLVLLNLNGSMGFKMLSASLLALSPSATVSKSVKETPLYPQRKADYNIVLLIGESMRYDSYVAAKLQALGFFYKKIYAGATNTDVALPLLLCAKNDPLKLTADTETNLFRLAKKNGYKTHFISMQTSKALQYIKPYLQEEQIDHYKNYTENERLPKYDKLLVDELGRIDFSEKQFIVMEQIGQHSPYRYFEGRKSDDIAENYKRSVDASFEIYEAFYKVLKEEGRSFIFIYVSDHGEFVGEGGRYGHNCFEPMVYTVPMFIVSDTTLPQGYEAILSHHHLSLFLTYVLGYGTHLTLPQGKIVVNGTMQNREDGFIELQP